MSASSSATTDHLQPCYLLKLPPELRNAIYELVVSFEEPIDLLSLPSTERCSLTCADCLYPGLTRLSGSQVGQESLAVFFSANHFMAYVRWNPYGSDWPTVEPNLWFYGYPTPESGIFGLRRAFERLGPRNCKRLMHVELRWAGAPKGEACLHGMTAWTALCMDAAIGYSCMPRSEVIKHVYLDPPPGPPPTVQAAFQIPPLPPPKLWYESEDPIRTTLRNELHSLALTWQRSCEPVNERRVRELIVDWVVRSAGHTSQIVKNFVRKEWQTTRADGRFRHRGAHAVLTNQTKHLCPLYKLTPELRTKIYELVLPSENTIPLNRSDLDMPDPAGGNGIWSFEPDAPPRFIVHLPALLRLNHEISEEASKVYFATRNFGVQLAFDAFDVGRFKELALSVKRLKCSVPMQIQVEWLWPKRAFTSSTLIKWAEMHSSSDQKLAQASALCITHKPAKTPLTRMLWDLVTRLHLMAVDTNDHRDKGKGRAGSPPVVLGFRPSRWTKSKLLDWILDDGGDEDCSDVKEMCRDVLRKEIDNYKASRQQSEEARQARLSGTEPGPPGVLETGTLADDGAVTLGPPPATTSLSFPPPPPPQLPFPDSIASSSTSILPPPPPPLPATDELVNVVSAPGDDAATASTEGRTDAGLSSVAFVPSQPGDAPIMSSPVVAEMHLFPLRHPRWTDRGCEYPFEMRKDWTLGLSDGY